MAQSIALGMNGTFTPLKNVKFCHQLLTQVVATLHEFLSSAEHKGRYLRNGWNFGTIDFHSILEVKGAKKTV